MALNIEQKKAVVAELVEVANSALSVVAAEYRGLTVGQMTDLRRRARSGGVFLKVAKNTLVRRAVADTEFDCIAEGLEGPLIFAFSQEDPGAAARLVEGFSKDHKLLVTRFVAVGGELYAADELKRLASLPTRDQALGMLMGVMKAPVEKLVRTLAEPQGKLVRTIAAIRDQKEAA